ncbi:putative bifunctional diguanylate cyclase/phosphodiesterase [Oceaniglobus indicus]|uniref:putative bifunctional diguanylate cyclase/phosphodiesterase n=1 Tax=Oceaniglobus indicus TaxID=2047749 RepID=UPI000C1939CA|nr:bifunctional diguanylate cyclase/phosphodiesterase [Oceaniglobus indicus]
MTRLAPCPLSPAMDRDPAATPDPLADLPDHHGFAQRLSLALATGADTVAVLNVRIDGFRSIEILLGRDGADGFLHGLAARLAQVIGTRGMLARGSGASFLIRLDQSAKGTADLLAQDIRAALRHPIATCAGSAHATASIGIARAAPGRGDDRPVAETLIRQAAIAAVAARTAGGNRRVRHTPAMDAHLTRQSTIVQALRQGLGNGEFTLAFQPKFALPNDSDPDTEDAFRLIGTEALLRWCSPELGRVGPAEFIPIAEKTGMIGDIDDYVMRAFARQLGRWHAAGHTVPASINLSPHSFEDEAMASRLLGLLERERVAATAVTVEITETALLAMSRHTIANFERLKAAGVEISVDDFGTGYSSLGYLRNSTVSEIKIDRSLVLPLPCALSDQATPDVAGSEAILRAILTLGRALGLRVVAEGVETREQMTWLRREGCRTIQGFLAGRAVAPELFERLHLSHRPGSQPSQVA